MNQRARGPALDANLEQAGPVNVTVRDHWPTLSDRSSEWFTAHDRPIADARGGGRYRATMTEPLPKEWFDRIFSKVPRLTVEVLITSKERGVLLALRDVDPCRGMWNLPGGTVASASGSSTR